MRERFNFKERINWFLTILMHIGVGSICLYFYFEADMIVAKVFLYIVATVTITLGANIFIDFFETLMRGIEETKTPFAESVIWLSPSMFILYQFNTNDGFIIKLILGILIIIFSFIFFAALTAAISDTALGKRIVGLTMDIFIISVFIIVAAILLDSVDILIFVFPLVLISYYSIYILINFLESSQSIKKQGNQKTRGSKNVYTGFQLSLRTLDRYFRQSFFKTLALLFAFVILSVFFVKGILPWSETISNLYTVSLTIYIVILSIIAGFSVTYMRERGIRGNALVLRKHFLGLAQMCIVFVIASLAGIVIGVGTHDNLFITGVKLSIISQSDDFLVNILAIVQTLVMEFVILSFAPTLMYIYAMLKSLHTSHVTND